MLGMAWGSSGPIFASGFYLVCIQDFTVGWLGLADGWLAWLCDWSLSEELYSFSEDINHLVFHPGGKKIVQTVEDLFGDLGKNIDDTKEVLRLYGNMSSATVLYVLERFMDRDLPKGDKGLMLSFGPGFSAQRILLEW